MHHAAMPAAVESISPIQESKCAAQTTEMDFHLPSDVPISDSSPPESSILALHERLNGTCHLPFLPFS
ncbi:uncharacterized protein N7503_001250 [Penicillium pulvis]|uniref:uncharacterized protein n=1 Tax=Penicillium pulvis TaxID=1562058 RepID=UPI0025485AAE|nr:uncharacterized protein N7503_001250 [Penicillium pulvis]KAJ5809032.1 hypothetical protein N7503_001250 [Penicillium pulvis]